MNEAKVVRLERRLAQVEAIAAGLREQITALQVRPPVAPEKSIDSGESMPAKKATRARKAAKKAG